MYPGEQTSVKLESKYKSFLSRKCPVNVCEMVAILFMPHCVKREMLSSNEHRGSGHSDLRNEGNLRASQLLSKMLQTALEYRYLRWDRQHSNVPMESWLHLIDVRKYHCGGDIGWLVLLFLPLLFIVSAGRYFFRDRMLYISQCLLSA